MRKLFMMAGLVALGIPMAYATVEVRIIDVGVADTGWITCAATSCSFVGSVGNYSITSNISSRIDPNNPFLDMSYSATSTVAAPGGIIIETRADGYTTNSPEFQLVGDGNTSFGGSSFIAGYEGVANTICPAGVNTCHASTTSTLITSFTVPTGSYHVAGDGSGNTVNPYELSLLFAMDRPTGPGILSGDIKLNAVPEPASVALLGGVLLVAVTAIRRKMRRV
jgi:hypothetical protein